MQLHPLNSFPVEEYLLTRVALSPDAAQVALGHKSFRTYDAASGAVRAEYDFPEFLGALRFSPDGEWIVAANVADNHPKTAGRISAFRVDGRQQWSAAAPLPVENFAFDGRGMVYWNHAETAPGELPHARSSIAGARLDDGAVSSRIELEPVQMRSLAALDHGFVVFGREAAGIARTVDNANLVFRNFRLQRLAADGQRQQDFDLGIGAGVTALSPDGRLLAAEMVDFKNNERHISLIDVETGVEANLLALEANTLPVLQFALGSEYLLCMKEDAQANFNRLRLWRTADLKLVGEAEVELGYHAMDACLERSTLAFLGAGRLDLFALE